MFLELIAVFIAGFAAAGLVMLLNRLTGNRLPKWLTPVLAGAAMLLATISSEYSWFDRTRTGLPEGLEVIQIAESRAAYRPWTYLAPFVNRFIALDTSTIQTNAAQTNRKIAELYFYGRWTPVQSAQVMIDCASGARADPIEGLQSEPIWRKMGADDPIISAVC